MRSKGSQSRLMRVICTPIRVLIKAKDLYVRSMTSCGERAAFVPAPSEVPRSFSVASSMSGGEGDDFRELMRAASARTLGHSFEKDLMEQLQAQRAADAAAANGHVPRSCSAGMARIDEDAPCDRFEEEEEETRLGSSGQIQKKKKKNLVYPRSRSYAL